MRPGRSGTEPATARSPLRMRRALGVFGVVWALAGAVAFALIDEPRWAALCAILWLVAVLDLMAVTRRIRRHTQPPQVIPPGRSTRPPER
ncbi:DUF6343 family protein [Streptomyces sp. NPDC058373]|uniref:DUF6343 family protein n=1 Tax=Streptomyces sp. NPDC058373 TaxID=3346465 RepID=UPI00366A112D